MSRENKIVLISLIFVFILILGLGGYFIFFRKKTEPEKPAHFADVIQFPENPQQGEPGYVEQDTTLTIGTEGTYKGNFEKIEDGKIFFRNQGFLSEILLNKDEIALQCTTESLDGVEEVDLSKVVNIKVFSRDKLVGVIPQGEPIVAIAGYSGTGVQVHTIAINSSKCPQ